MLYGLDEFEFDELLEGGVLEEVQGEDSKNDGDKLAEEDEEPEDPMEVGTADVDADL